MFKKLCLLSVFSMVFVGHIKAAAMLDESDLNIKYAATVEESAALSNVEDYVSRLCKGVSDEACKESIKGSFDKVADDSREAFVELVEWMFAQGTIKEVYNDFVVQS